MKNVLIINGHPKPGSYCSALAQAYVKGASQSGYHTLLLNLYELEFNYNQVSGLKQNQDLETDLRHAQDKMKWANHIVIVHPVWWGSVPAILKAFFDRILLSGFAFQYHKKGPWWDKLLAGRSARIIYTSDSPSWFYKWLMKEPSVKQVKERTLEFCGIKPVKLTSIGNLRFLNESQRLNWLSRIEQLGKTGL